MEAGAKVKLILEHRIEELSAVRHQLHNKIVAYGGTDSDQEMRAIAREYQELEARRALLVENIAKF